MGISQTLSGALPCGLYLSGHFTHHSSSSMGSLNRSMLYLNRELLTKNRMYSKAFLSLPLLDHGRVLSFFQMITSRKIHPASDASSARRKGSGSSRHRFSSVSRGRIVSATSHKN